jgi:hypothetical protein
MEYCYKSGFFGKKDIKPEQNKFNINIDILFQQNNSHEKDMKRIREHLAATQEYLLGEKKRSNLTGGYKHKYTKKNINTNYSKKL